MLKALCMCRGGFHRSVALKRLLWEEAGIEAIAVGHDFNTAPTIDMLCEWADWIFVVMEDMRRFVPEKHAAKVKVVFAGNDLWGPNFHPRIVANLRLSMAAILDEIERSKT